MADLHNRKKFKEEHCKETFELLKLIVDMDARRCRTVLNKIVREKRHNVFGTVVITSSSVRRIIRETAKRKVSSDNS